MSDIGQAVELNETTLLEAYHQLFDTQEGAPPRLYDPARALLRANDPNQSVEKRLSHLAQMSKQADRLFRDYLSPLAVVGNQPKDSEQSWPIALARWVEQLHGYANNLLGSALLPDLARLGFDIVSIDEATDHHGEWIHDYFKEQIYPLLTPLAVDPGRPFPHISSDSLNLLVKLSGGHRQTTAVRMARVKIPILTPRLIQFPVDARASAADTEPRPRPVEMVWSLDLVRHFVDELFVDIPIMQVYCFRVLRASASFAGTAEDNQSVHGRTALGSVVRVDVEADMPAAMFEWLVDHLDVISYSVVRFESPGEDMSLPELAQAVTAWMQSSPT